MPVVFLTTFLTSSCKSVRFSLSTIYRRKERYIHLFPHELYIVAKLLGANLKVPSAYQDCNDVKIESISVWQT